MTDNVVRFTGITKLDIDPALVLRDATDEGLAEVVVIGFAKDGSEYFASSIADGGTVLWHMERAKHKLMLIADEAGE